MDARLAGFRAILLLSLVPCFASGLLKNPETLAATQAVCEGKECEFPQLQP